MFRFECARGNGIVLWSPFQSVEWIIRPESRQCWQSQCAVKISFYRSLLASRSDSSKVRRSPSRTGPFTFRIICRFCSPRNSTLTCVHCPWEPVRPRTFITRAKTTGLSMIVSRGFDHLWCDNEKIYKGSGGTVLASRSSSKDGDFRRYSPVVPTGGQSSVLFKSVSERVRVLFSPATRDLCFIQGKKYFLSLNINISIYSS